MKNIKLKNNSFEAIQVTGYVEQFPELKQLCRNNVQISYESCYIDDYWLIKVYDAIAKDWKVVSNSDWIIKINTNKFITISNSEYETNFAELEQVSLNEDDITKLASEYVETVHSSDSASEFQVAMNLAAAKAYIQGYKTALSV